MMTIEQEYGLNAGLNKIKLKKVLKKVSLKNAVKLTKKALPIATSFIPMGGGFASGLVSKALNSGAGKLATKVVTSKAGKAIGKGIKVVKTVKKNTPKTTKPTIKKTSNVQFPLLRTLQPEISDYTENLQPVAQPVATSSARMVDSDFQPESFTDITSGIDTGTTPSPLPTQTKDNTLLYVGGGALLLTAIYFATKKSN